MSDRQTSGLHVPPTGAHSYSTNRSSPIMRQRGRDREFAKTANHQQFLSRRVMTASTRTFSIDKAHSDATFQVRHLLTKVRGRFTDFSGTIQFNPDQPEQNSVTFTIDAASIDTNTADRDTHLRSEDFFFVTEHPHITF